LVAVFAVIAGVWVHRRRQRATTCQAEPGRVDMGMPTRIPPGTSSDRLPQ
jgi:hypothetical protein